ncbi:MAG: exo-alpha-sialidase [Verrucomicrobia bacterium]|nr:exo-alpha-sialidase [Verrucomicrobiota bacterium]
MPTNHPTLFACLRQLALFVVLTVAVAQASAAVSFERLPESGLQPQAVATPDGTVHLIYLTGEAKASDIIYRRRATEGGWSEPLKVNSQAGSAVAIGTIRGPQLALGRNGRANVVWNGSQSAEPKAVNGGAPLLYARLDDDGRSFSAQRDLIGRTHELDGGGSVATDAEGRVFVVWHASPAGQRGETNRAVFLAVSTDDGKTFASERSINPAGSGACGCCGLTALARPSGDVSVLFRTARTMMQRDMALLVSTDHGKSFKESFADPWSVGMCPMSSATVSAAGTTTLAAWETSGRVHMGRFSNADGSPDVRAVGPLKGAKHPRLAINGRGETLMVWTEGTGWQSGGSLAWQVFDAQGEPTGEKGKRDGVAAWSYATTYARPDGDFVILH